jgi:hypothetical protein
MDPDEQEARMCKLGRYLAALGISLGLWGCLGAEEGPLGVGVDGKADSFGEEAACSCLQDSSECSRGAFSGQVFDLEGEQLIGARVIFLSRCGAEFEATTDDNGLFVISVRVVDASGRRGTLLLEYGDELLEYRYPVIAGTSTFFHLQVTRSDDGTLVLDQA